MEWCKKKKNILRREDPGGGVADRVRFINVTTRYSSGVATEQSDQSLHDRPWTIAHAGHDPRNLSMNGFPLTATADGLVSFTASVTGPKRNYCYNDASIYRHECRGLSNGAVKTKVNSQTR